MESKIFYHEKYECKADAIDMETKVYFENGKYWHYQTMDGLSEITALEAYELIACHEFRKIKDKIAKYENKRQSIKFRDLYKAEGEIYYEVPYKHKEKMKALGGRFDRDKKLWFLSKNLDKADDLFERIAVKKSKAPWNWWEYDARLK